MKINNHHGPCDCSSVDEIVNNHRTDLVKFALHGDDFIRVLAIAALIQAGGTAELTQVKREIEIAAEVSDRWN
ncbi:hypothetical protein [Natrarchaeobius oligotrophus]|uniref:hypothetical protein n=1 Tax=Natrarchaeobius oligotrophus TaxID=3455743 RepID=UPI000F536611|nr:hypothetical protein [Natrarchaeobius chitinivorans]